MLAIRMQRTGRKGHAQFRVVVQDSRRTPTSGRIVAALGSYNPHSKATTLDKEKTAYYLEHGAQPSARIVRLLKAEGVKLPDWVKVEPSKERTTRNPEKLRKNRPAEEKAEAPEEPKAEEAPVEAETPAEEPAKEEAPAEKPAEPQAEKAEEKPAAEEAKK